ncbi:hypothetical protein LTS18_011322 [Coniosporium uncinatum]|uniref:Uncharacterized protein n=1 Tax=Coniosporium uncinatum TaxID=93489 RepID=A0ACC3CYZ8_9PEZI|nr:hypothetical protein LTS18_011322 [Coniosporium uncinatum]
MASEQTFSTEDLRSHAIEAQRYQDQKHKWALGQAWGPGRLSETHAKPVKPLERAAIRQVRRQLNEHHPKPIRKLDLVSEQHHISGDSSADEDVEEASAAPEPVSEPVSYDVNRAPTQGSHILSIALAKAVDRFESAQTDKLVKNEYEVLDNEGETVTKKGRGLKVAVPKDPGMGEEEDDYEFV